MDSLIFITHLNLNKNTREDSPSNVNILCAFGPNNKPLMFKIGDLGFGKIKIRTTFKNYYTVHTLGISLLSIRISTWFSIATLISAVYPHSNSVSTHRQQL